jgi:hypothetical protein
MRFLGTFKTFKWAEPLESAWISLHWRDRGPGCVVLQLVLTMPWKVRLYNIHSASVEIRRPTLSIWWTRPWVLHWYHDPFTHQFTRAEYEGQLPIHLKQLLKGAETGGGP